MKHISSRDNPQYKEWLGLANDRRARRQSGCTLLDGPHLVQAEWDAGLSFRQLLFSASALEGELADWCQRLPNTRHAPCRMPLFNALTPVETPVGMLAVIDIPRPANDRLTDCIVLLENIQDPGNLGALLRVAAAAGADSVHLSQGCAEVWSPKCLRGGQGAHFQLAIHETVDLPALARDFGAPVYAASLGGTALLFDLDLRGRVGFAFGNEGAGLSAPTARQRQPFINPDAGQGGIAECRDSRCGLPVRAGTPATFS